jgi:hypothetical protein
MFKFEMSKVFATPLEVGLKLTKAMSPQIENKKEHTKKVPYQSAIGNLMYYMICIRVDIAYSVGVVSQFFTYLKEIHWKVVRRIFRYLKGTSMSRLLYDGKRSANLVGL